MATPPIQDADIAELRRPIEGLRSRLAFQRATVALLAWGLPPVAVLLVFRLYLRLLGHPPWPLEAVGWVLCLLFVAVTCAQVRKAALTHPEETSLALRIDRWLGKGDRLSSALCFAKRPKTARTPIEEAVIAQGITLANGVDPKPIAPTPRLRLYPWYGLLLLHGLLFFFCVDLPRKRHLTVTEPLKIQPITAVDGSAPSDDLAELQRRLAVQLRAPLTPEFSDSWRQLRNLLAEFKSGQIDRDSAIEQLVALRSAWRKPAPYDAIGNELAVKAVGQTLERVPFTRDLGSALSESRYADALDALGALKKRLSDPSLAPSPEELSHLRAAIEESRQSALAEAAKQAEQVTRLAKEQQELLNVPSTERDTAATLSHQQALNRQLQQLSRDRETRDHKSRALNELDRALKRAASKLRDQLGSPFEDFSSLEQDLHAQEAAKLRAEDKQRLLEQLEELLSTLQQPHRNNATRRAQLAAFGARAAASGTPSAPAGATAEGEPREQFSPNPEGSALAMRAEEELRLVEIESSDNAIRNHSGGRSLGKHHDENLTGKPTPLDVTLGHETSALTTSTSNDTVSAEVVATAAQRGFMATDYAAVYRAYYPQRESLLHNPAIPREKREQVQRYFDLIRPRGAAP